MSARRVQPHHDRRMSNSNTSHHSSPSSHSGGGEKRFDHINTARRKFGAKVNLSGLGPGNERVVAAELLLIDAVGGPAVVMDVTRSSIPFPHQQLFQYQQQEIMKNPQQSSSYSDSQNNNNGYYGGSPQQQQKKEIVLVETERDATPLDKVAWELIASYRTLWIEAWEGSDSIRSSETRERKELSRLAKISYHQSQKMSRIQAMAWVMIEEIEEDVRERLMHEQELVWEGLLHFFRGRKNEIEIDENLRSSW